MVLIRTLLLLLLLLAGLVSRADTLQVQLPSPGHSIEQQLSVLFGSLEDKSSVIILSYNGSQTAQEIKQGLVKNGVAEFRIKIVAAGGRDHPADIIYSPSKNKALHLAQDDIGYLLRNTGTGQTIALRNIRFVPGKAVITRDSYPELEKLFDLLKANKKLKVGFEGHVCCLAEKEGDTTTAGYKMSLSRARAVYQYLADRGIETTRMSYAGFSSWRRPRKEQTEEEEIRNRRVEIRILEQ